MPMDSPGIERAAACARSPARASSARCSSTRCASPSRTWSGAENDGWRVAMVTFSFERGTAFVSELLGSMRLLADLVEIARKTPLGTGHRVGRRRHPPRPDARRRRARRPVGADQAQRRPGPPATAARASAGRCSSSPTTRPASAWARSPCGCWAGPAWRSTTRPGCRPATSTTSHQRLYALSLSIAAGHGPDPAQHRGRAAARPAQGEATDGLRADRRPGRAARPSCAGFLADRVTPEARRAVDRHARGGRPRPVACARRHGRVRPHPPRGPTAASGLGLAEATIVFEELGRAARARPAAGHVLRRRAPGDGATEVVDLARRRRRARPWSACVPAGDPAFVEHLRRARRPARRGRRRRDADRPARTPARAGRPAARPADPGRRGRRAAAGRAGRRPRAGGRACAATPASLLAAALQVGLAEAAVALGHRVRQGRGPSSAG